MSPVETKDGDQGKIWRQSGIVSFGSSLGCEVLICFVVKTIPIIKTDTLIINYPTQSTIIPTLTKNILAIGQANLGVSSPPPKKIATKSPHLYK